MTVPESTTSGAAVYVFTVTDADPHDTLTMEMVSTDNSFFSLDINNSKYNFYSNYKFQIYFQIAEITCNMMPQANKNSFR